MEKFALGVHHFNLLYVAGQKDTYHRQVREAIIPFVDLLVNHPTWSVNVEIQGYAVEFIAEHYPGVLEKLKYLIDDSKQIELISCHYAPQLWIAFPKYDMQKSVQMNDEILMRHGLRRSRIFFAQENFSGEGVQVLSDDFDICVFKRDYYYYLSGIQEPRPYYTMGPIRVIIGACHILQSVSEMIFPDVNGNRPSRLADRFNIIGPEIRDYLRERRRQNYEQGRSYTSTGEYGDIQWKWYHVGSSEHFAKHQVSPQDVWNCWFDPSWLALMERSLMDLEADGYMLSTIGDFVTEVDRTEYRPEPVQPILDGCWNMKSCRGVYQWMGFHGNRYEADCIVRSHNWRTRARLIACECLMKHPEFRHLVSDGDQALIQQAWQHQLLAEGSDSTGWWPTPDEVQFSVSQSEEVANIVARVISGLKHGTHAGLLSVDVQKGEIVPFKGTSFAALEEVDLPASLAKGLEMFGSRGQIALYRISESTQRLAVVLNPVKGICGIAFDLETDELRYSPALMEDRLVTYPLSGFLPEEIFLPLTNGLIAVNTDTYLIKHNDTMHIACCIDKEARKIKFQIENTGASHSWTMTVFKGTEEQALHLANKINVWPTVIL